MKDRWSSRAPTRFSERTWCLRYPWPGRHRGDGTWWPTKMVSRFSVFSEWGSQTKFCVTVFWRPCSRGVPRVILHMRQSKTENWLGTGCNIFLTSVCLDDYWNQQRVWQVPCSPRISDIHKKHYSGGLSLSYQPLIDNIGGHRSANPKWKGAFGLNPWKDGQRHGTKILNSEPGFDLGILMFQCQGWTPRPKIKTRQQV